MVSKDSVIVKQANNIKKIDMTELLTKVIEGFKKDITDQLKEQLKFGQNSSGKKITPQYASDDYAHKKNMQNSLPSYGTPDLYKTGEMYANLDFLIGVPNDKEYSFYSDVDYFNDLLNKYLGAFDLSKKSIVYLRDKIQKEFFKQLHELINK